jgi:hypothetical protein
VLSSVRKRGSLGRNSAVPLTLIEDEFQGITTNAHTVAITNVWEWADQDIGSLVAFLKRYKLMHIRRGWCKIGYAVVFRSESKASLFRCLYPGETTLIRDDG